MKENKSLADFLRDKRIESGFSQLDIAKKLGYTSPQFISNWERGLSSPPIHTLRKLTDLYQIPPDILFEVALKTIIQQITLDMRKKFYGKKRKK